MTADSSKRAWTVRCAAPSDRDRCLLLASRAFQRDPPTEQDRARWDWLFLQNVSGARMHYMLADAGERLAGQYAVMPVAIQHGGKRTVGLISLDTATDPSFGRQGIFTTLARAVYSGAEDEASVVFGFPNPNSAPGFYEKLGWVELRPFPVFARPLGHLSSVIASWRPKLAMLGRLGDATLPLAGHLGRAVGMVERLRGADVMRVEDFGPWADDLWQTLSPDLGTCVVRNAAYLNWRYVDSPFEYERYALRRHGRLIGLAVTTTVPWRGGRLCYLMDLLVPKEDAGGARLLLAEAMLDAAQQGAFALVAFATDRQPHRSAMLHLGLLPAPRSAKTQSFGVRPIGSSNVANLLLHVSDWYVSCGDLDFL